MTLTKRKLVAIFSLEHLLFTLIYLPIVIVVLMTMPEVRWSKYPGETLLRMAIIFGPPLLWMVANGLIIRALVRNARRDERARSTMRFGLAFNAAQAALAAALLFNVVWMFGHPLLSVAPGIVGLAVAAMMKSEKT